MAQTEAQQKWRRKNKFVKRQLNVMARKLIHEYLEEIAGEHDLRGKGEAVAFACFVTKSIHQQAEYNEDARRILDIFTENFHRDRELYSP